MTFNILDFFVSIQVELMYDALKRSQVTANPRVLVLIPEGYMQRKRHNAVTPRRGTVTSTDDYVRGGRKSKI